MNNHEQKPVYEQAPLWGDVEQGELVELSNCLVLNEARCARLKKGTLITWECGVHVQPDLFHQEQAGTYLLHAQQEAAVLAQKAKLKPGDRVSVTGRCLPPQAVMLGNGEQKIINHLAVVAIQVLARAPRISTTSFETRRGR